MRDYNGWEEVFLPEFQKDYFVKLKSFLLEEYKTKDILPRAGNILRAFDLVEPREIKAVILGQDPYPTVGHAIGLASADRRRFDAVGEAGGAFAQHLADGRGEKTQQPPRARVGIFYRRGDKLCGQAGAARSLYAVGEQRHSEKVAFEKPRPPRFDCAASQPLVGVSGVYGLRAFFKGQRIP